MAANVAEPNRLLSIQSHVVSGYVGELLISFLLLISKLTGLL